MAKANAVQEAASLTDKIDAQIAAAQRDEFNAAQAYGEVSLQLVEQPANTRVHEALAALAVERDTAAEKVRSLKSARAEASRRDSAEAQVAELKTLRADVAQVGKNLEEITRLALELQYQALALGPIRQQIADLATENQRLGWKSVKAAFNGDQRRAERDAGILSLARGSSVDYALAGALQGVAGPWIQISRHFEAVRPLDEQLARDHSAVNQKLAQLVEARERELSGKATKPVVPTQQDRFIRAAKVEVPTSAAAIAAAGAPAGESVDIFRARLKKAREDERLAADGEV